MRPPVTLVLVTAVGSVSPAASAEVPLPATVPSSGPLGDGTLSHAPASDGEPLRPANEAARNGNEPTSGWLALERSSPWYEYWAKQNARWFVGAEVAVGAFNRARAIVGYGRPFWQWEGLDLQIASTSEFGTVLVGPRIDALVVNAALDLRATWSYARREPLRAHSYRSLEDEGIPGVPNRYTSLDAWLWGYVPAGPLLGYWEGGGVYLLSDPAPYAVFEELFRMMMNGRVAAMLRTAISLKLLNQTLLLGPAGDVVLSPERSALVRVGGSVSFQVTAHMAVNVLVTAPVLSPDELDWFTQSWGIARLSYAWASGEPRSWP